MTFDFNIFGYFIRCSPIAGGKAKLTPRFWRYIFRTNVIYYLSVGRHLVAIEKDRWGIT